MSQLKASDIKRIATLSQIAISDDELPMIEEKLESTLAILNQLQNVDTTNVEPMSDPFDRTQPFREDIVTESNHRDDYQVVAPSVEKGLYLVPKVIE